MAAPKSSRYQQALRRSALTGFSLIALDAAEDAIASFEQAAKSLKLPLRIIRDSFAGGREEYGARMVLVRPDHYVAWAGDTADATAVLKKASGN